MDLVLVPVAFLHLGEVGEKRERGKDNLERGREEGRCDYQAQMRRKRNVSGRVGKEDWAAAGPQVERVGLGPKEVAVDGTSQERQYMVLAAS